MLSTKFMCVFFSDDLCTQIEKSSMEDVTKNLSANVIYEVRNTLLKNDCYGNNGEILYCDLWSCPVLTATRRPSARW